MTLTVTQGAYLWLRYKPLYMHIYFVMWCRKRRWSNYTKKHEIEKMLKIKLFFLWTGEIWRSS